MAAQAPPRWIFGAFPGTVESFAVDLVPVLRAHIHTDGMRPSLNSWWRSVASNKRVGGAPWSQHLIGTAVDLQYPSVRAAEAAIADYKRAGFVAMKTGRTGKAVHVQWRPAGELESVLRISGYESFAQLARRFA